MGMSISQKRHLANLGCYGGGTLLAASMISLVFTKVTGLNSKLSQAGFKHSGKILVASSFLSAGALIAGLIYRKKLGGADPSSSEGEEWRPSARPSDTRRRSEKLRGEGNFKSSGWMGGFLGPFTWSKTLGGEKKIVVEGWKSKTVSGPDGVLTVKRRGNQAEVYATEVRHGDTIIRGYSWSGEGEPTDAVGRFIVDTVERGTQSVLELPDVGDSWGPGRSLRGSHD